MLFLKRSYHFDYHYKVRQQHVDVNGIIYVNGMWVENLEKKDKKYYQIFKINYKIKNMKYFPIKLW